MHIELIGCTSAGKTTLTKKVLENGRRRGIQIISGDDFVLQKLHLKSVKSEFIRRRIMEICAVYICFRHWGKYKKFCQNVFQSVFSQSLSGDRLYKLNLMRIVLRKVGIYEIIRQNKSKDQLILVDNEGIIQAAHNLFVHTNTHLNGNLSAFLNTAPLPDLIFYLKQPQEVLLQRTLLRGHPRIPVRSLKIVEDFVTQAVTTFEKLHNAPLINNRLMVIDAQNRQVINSAEKKSLDKIAGNLLQEGIINNSERAPKEKENSADKLFLIDQLIEKLAQNNIEYCHWKSNVNLAESLQGKGDLDLYVSQSSERVFLKILEELGFKAAKVRYGYDTEYVRHIYGLDKTTGKLLHIHLFTNVITGESFVKSHALPLGTMFLENYYRYEQLPVITKEAELVLFILRTYIKYGSLPDILRLFNISEVYQELEWLLEDNSIVKALQLLNKHCPEVNDNLFLKCIAAIRQKHSLLKRIVLAQKIRRKLKKYSKYRFYKKILAYAVVITSKIKCIISGNGKNKMLASGGLVIAIVGADATGKSTLVKEATNWLGNVFAVKKVHLGKPPATFFTILIKIALPLFRKVLPQIRLSKMQSLKEIPSDNKNNVKTNGLSFFYAVRAVALAWDRFKLIKKVMNYKKKGNIIICDRYPSNKTGAMDSPRLLETKANPKGIKNKIFNSMVLQEKKLYSKMPPADIVIKLKVSLSTARQRNSQREDRDEDDFIKSRHQKSHNWDRDDVPKIIEIDTDQTLPETILALKNNIWESI